jgi:patatin-like phospholipase/acyl hydrolase
LAEFERQLLDGSSAGDYFDLITGTSTGGIIALALAIGLPAQAILQIYLEHGEEIFPPVDGRLARLKRFHFQARTLLHYRYNREPLEKQIRAVFGGRLFGSATRRLCIPSFDGFTEINVFKTPHHPDFRLDWKEEMSTVALATSAAPTFFSVYKNNDRRFADGGVWANNPVMIGLVDALTCYNVDRRQIHIMTLGCGESEMLITDRQVRFGGLIHWREIISAAMHLASQNALGQAGLLVGRDRLFRIDAPLAPDSPIKLDDYRRSRDELLPLGAELAQAAMGRACAEFFTEAATPYQAFYGERAEAERLAGEVRT